MKFLHDGLNRYSRKSELSTVGNMNDKDFWVSAQRLETLFLEVRRHV